jgi:uncharacterized membrane protein
MGLIQRRPRLILAFALGLVAGLVPLRGPDDMLHVHFLIGWNVAVWTYLVLIGLLILRSGHTRTRAISEGEDPNAITVLVLGSLMAVASLAAIGMELARAASPAHYVNAAVTLLGSWLMLNTLFSFHYAHLYFRAPAADRPLRFPEDPQPDPDFWDFLYFSFTIAVATQTSDISIVSSAMRKTVLAHSVLAFLFNVAILGATINVVSAMLH